MRRMATILATLATLAGIGGCGAAPRPAPDVPGTLKLGMTPEEVVAAAGTPDRQTLLEAGTSALEIIWTYRRDRRVRFQDGDAVRDFPRGCSLSFSGDGRHLTEVRPAGIPDEAPKPPAPPAGQPPPLPKPLAPAEAARRVEVLLAADGETLQPALDLVMIQFQACLPALGAALDRPDAPYPVPPRLFIASPPGTPEGPARRVRPASRHALLLHVLNTGTGRHFGSPASPSETAEAVARWKAWLAGGGR